MPDGNLVSSTSFCSEDDDWLVRNKHWISEAERATRPRRRRERQKEPLILCGHGVSLRVDGGTLLIRNGLTHYPQQREEFRFFKGDPALPPRVIMLDGSGSISFDVLDWLAEQRVPLIRIDWKGEVVSVLASSGFSADQAKLRWQVETRADPAQRIEFATKLIAERSLIRSKRLRKSSRRLARRRERSCGFAESINGCKPDTRTRFRSCSE